MLYTSLPYCFLSLIFNPFALYIAFSLKNEAFVEDTRAYLFPAMSILDYYKLPFSPTHNTQKLEDQRKRTQIR